MKAGLIHLAGQAHLHVTSQYMCQQTLLGAPLSLFNVPKYLVSTYYVLIMMMMVCHRQGPVDKAVSRTESALTDM